MPKKLVRRYDLEPSNAGFGAPPTYSTPTGTGGDSGSGTTTGGDTTGGVFVPPDVPTVTPPTNLHVISTDLSFSGTVGKWFVKIGWDAVDSASSYLLQWYRQGFGSFDNPVSVSTDTESATFEVYMNGTYDVRVKAYQGTAQSDWSSTLTFTADIDPTPPGAPTDVNAVFADNGDLVITWTVGTGAQLRDTLVDLFASSNMSGTPLKRYAVAGNAFVWSLKDNLAAGGLPDVWVRLSSRSYALVLSLPAYPATQPSYALPDAPSVTASWNLQTGAMTLGWDALARAVKYEVYVDGVLQPQQVANRYVYTLDMNKAAHGGNPNISLTYGVQGWDVFGRVGTQTSGVTDAPDPPVPTSLSSSFESPDAYLVWAISEPVYSFDVVIDGVSRAVGGTSYLYPLALNTSEHSGTPHPVLTVQVRSRSILDCVSTYASITATNPVPTAPSAVAATGYFSGIAILATATLPLDLKAVRYRIVKDGSTLTAIDTQSTQYTYTAPSSGSYQIGVKIVDVFDQASSETLSSAVTLDMLTISELRATTSYTDSIGNSSTTLAVLKDDVRSGTGVTYSTINTWLWTEASRPLLDRIKRVTLAASTCDAAYIATSQDGSTWSYFSGPLGADGHTLSSVASQSAAQTGALILPTDGYWDLPSITECRFVRLYHKHSASHTLYEFYPRRLVQSDDIEAEAIKAIHIGAGAVTADKIDALAINGMTITGVTINGSTYNVGSNDVLLDANGITIAADTTNTPATNHILKFGADITTFGRVWGHETTTPELLVQTYRSGANTRINISSAASSTTDTASLDLRGTGSGGSTATLSAGTSGSNATVTVAPGGVTISRLNVGTATGAVPGEVKTSGNANIGGLLNVAGVTAMHGAPPDANVALYIKGIGTTSGTRGLRVVDTSGNINLDIYDNGTGVLRAASWTYTSDAKAKRNVAKYNKAKIKTEQLKAIEIEQFDYIDGATQQVGYIANALKEVLPDAVVVLEDGTLAVRSLEPWIVLWLQQLLARVEALEAKK